MTTPRRSLRPCWENRPGYSGVCYARAEIGHRQLGRDDRARALEVGIDAGHVIQDAEPQRRIRSPRGANFNTGASAAAARRVLRFIVSPPVPPHGTVIALGRCCPHIAIIGESLQAGDPMPITINGREAALATDPRTSLLDLLREHLHLTGTKKGCNQGACGACTVLVDGERILSCLALAVQYEGRSITTVEGLASDGALHALQQAFLEHDGYQCGYCTPGQLCSAVGMAGEARRGVPSAVTADLGADHVQLTGQELRERMSGNLCRCGAHNGIIAAISQTFGEAA